MSGFIEVVDVNGKRQYINTNYIETVAEMEDKKCCIYLAFNCPHAIEQDYCQVNKSYDEIVFQIRMAGD